MFTIAIVSNQIQSNHIAWSLPIAKADTIEEAEILANEEFRKIVDELDMLPDFENGVTLGKTIIIHDGENIY